MIQIKDYLSEHEQLNINNNSPEKLLNNIITRAYSSNEIERP